MVIDGTTTVVATAVPLKAACSLVNGANAVVGTSVVDSGVCGICVDPRAGGHGAGIGAAFGNCSAVDNVGDTFRDMRRCRDARVIR